jgi:hypothetical protein
VFFNLAKARLPKADRNRIFRVRPVVPADGDGDPPTNPVAPAPQIVPAQPSPAPRVLDRVRASTGDERARPSAGGEDRGRRIVELPTVSRPAFGSGPAANRRRVVEVEVLRHPAKSAMPQPEPRPAPAPQPVAPAPQPRPVEEVRPLRRIVVAPVRDEPAATPEAARDRVRTLIRGLGTSDQRRVISDLLDELGGPEKLPEPEEVPEEPMPAPVDRERVLSAVVDALGLGSADLARALYDDDAPGPRAKARAALERWRKG